MIQGPKSGTVLPRLWTKTLDHSHFSVNRKIEVNFSKSAFVTFSNVSMSVSDMAKSRKGKMTPRSARRVIKKYVRKNPGNFTKRVQKIVDRNLKNTPTGVVRYSDSICTIVDTQPTVRRWYLFTPGTGVFKRNMGAGGIK